MKLEICEQPICCVNLPGDIINANSIRHYQGVSLS